MWRGQICTEAWCPNILYVLSQKCSSLRCVFYFEGRERKYCAWLRAGRCATVRVHHVAAVYGWGVPECVEGAGRAAAGGRMGAVRGDDGSENLPALWQGRKSPVKLLLLLQEKRPWLTRWASLNECGDRCRAWTVAVLCFHLFSVKTFSCCQVEYKFSLIY